MKKKTTKGEEFFEITKKDLKMLGLVALIAIVAIGAYMKGLGDTGTGSGGISVNAQEDPIVQQEQVEPASPTHTQTQTPPEPAEAKPRDTTGARPSSGSCGGACGSPTCGAKTDGGCGCGGGK